MSPIAAFDFATAGHVAFGRGRAGEAVGAIAALAERVALVHGANAARADWLAEALTAAGRAPLRIGVEGEPALPALAEALEQLRAAGVDGVIALGGGAAIDMGKALAALAPQPQGPMSYLEVVGEGHALAADPLPFVALPSTAGTGAEVTRNAVIGVPEARRKVSLRDARMLPRLAIVDPRLTDGAPRSVTLACGLDALTQVIEPFTCARANPLTDALAAAAIPAGIKALRRLMEAEDPAARDEMAWVSLCGGMALANSGLGAVHGLAGVLGGRATAPHGALCGALLPHVLQMNAARTAPDSPAAERLERVLTLLAAGFGGEDGAAALAGWAHASGLPRLSEMGIDPADHREVAESASASSSMKANPVALSRDDLCAVLRAAG